jgi:hypothetical protein
MTNKIKFLKFLLIGTIIHTSNVNAFDLSDAANIANTVNKTVNQLNAQPAPVVPLSTPVPAPTAQPTAQNPIVQQVQTNASVTSKGIEFICTTEKHTIFIDKLDAKTYRYREWNKPKSTDTKPDMELKSSTVQIVGGTSHYYTFKTGNTEFEVTDQWTGSNADSNPNPSEVPIGATGDLYIRSKGNLKSHYYCVK